VRIDESTVEVATNHGHACDHPTGNVTPRLSDALDEHDRGEEDEKHIQDSRTEALSR
jgi:hypothetical protein